MVSQTVVSSCVCGGPPRGLLGAECAAGLGGSAYLLSPDGAARRVLGQRRHPAGRHARPTTGGAGRVVLGESERRERAAS